MVDPSIAPVVGWGLSAATWLISPILSRLLNQCFDALGLDLPTKFQSRKRTLLEKLETLQTRILPQLLILMNAAQQSPHLLDLETWLQKLKSAFYEAEHVLGLIEYDRLEKEVNSLSQEKEKEVTSLFPSSSCNVKGKQPKWLLKLWKNLIEEKPDQKKNLIESIENLEKIITKAMEFVPLLGLPANNNFNNSNGKPNQQYRKRKTISIPGLQVIGRDRDRDDIVKLLKKDVPRSCYSVIGIWGMGGSGKTTLAQYVCDFVKETEPKLFDPTIWVHVSDDFNVWAIMRRIWEKVHNTNCPNFENEDVLLSQLADKLRGKRFLLVLDDVWCDKGVTEDELNQLFAPLNVGENGSKILVTTRNEEAAKRLGATDVIKLRELDDKEFLTLFMTHALRNVPDNGDLEDLQTIGEEIAGKLCRLPLAAIIVAGQLHAKQNLDFWSSMRYKSFSSDIMGVLYLSYQHLAPPLQRCFAFSSLFPRGHNFRQDHLVKLWIAEGFIEPEGSEHITDIANRYFEELISCSLFQAEKMCHDQLYSMHDLIYDLAQHASQDECFKIMRSGDEKIKIPIQTRHLYVADDMLEEYLEKICEIKDLRTIILVSGYLTGDPLKQVHLDALFTNLRKLYVAELLHIENLPKSVIHLKNLRYLTFQIAQPATIPEALNTLYQLRTLTISKAYHFDENHVAIPNIGRLVLLQDLGEFHVGNKGFELKQLKHLNNLFGMLTIKNLDRVEREEDANQAELYKKQGIRNLRYHWGYESGDILRDIDVKILDCFCPPARTKQLTFDGYSGNKFPRWILEHSSTSNIRYLKHLELSYCGGLESLEGINKLSKLLSLTISYLPRLKKWERVPPKLTELKLTNCLSLVFGEEQDLQVIMRDNSMQISQIVTFLENCREEKLSEYTNIQFNYVKRMMKLAGGHTDTQATSAISKDLPKCLEKRLELICQLENVNGELYLPRVLKKLSIGSCFITDNALKKALYGLNSLTELELVDIVTITCIPEEVLISLTSLRFLEIRGCLLLTEIGGWDTHNTLEQLWIYNCPNLTLKASVVPDSCDTAEQPPSSRSSMTNSSVLNFVKLLIYNWKASVVSDGCNTAEQLSSLRSSKTNSSVLNYVKLQCCMPLDDAFKNLVSLETLQIWDCPTIVKPHIGYLKSLEILDLLDCSKLESLEGLNELKNLKKMDTRRCQKFECPSNSNNKLPRLEELKICKFSQLEQVLSIDGLASLVALELWHAQEGSFSEEECKVLSCLSSLKQISFYHCKMHSLPNLQCVDSLRELNINFCVNLTTLPELPSLINSLSIRECNEEFTKSCQDSKGTSWDKICDIPNKRIELKKFHSGASLGREKDQ